MNEATARAIVLEYFTKPDFDRVHFLIRMEKETSTPPDIFARYIMGAWEFYFDKLNYKVMEARGWGNDTKDYGIPFWHLAPNKYPAGFGDLYFSQMPIYWAGIKQYINERCNFLPIVTDGETYRYQFDQSEVPENLIWDYKKWFEPRPKFQLKDEALKEWETKYKYWLDHISRPELRPFLLAKGIEYAEILLNHCQQYEPKDLHQIDSLQRRINVAKRMAGINQGKGVKEPNIKSTKRELTDLTAVAIALIHVFTKEPITTENKNDIAARYINPASGKPYSPDKLYNEYGLIPATETERLRQAPTQTLFNHYTRCINWLNSKGNAPAKKAAHEELKQLEKKKFNH